MELGGKYHQPVSGQGYTITVYDPLTHWGRDNMAAIFRMSFWNGFSWMKIYEFRLKFHWSLFLGVQLTIFQHWFRTSDNGSALTRQQIIIWTNDVRLSMHICITQPQWVKWWIVIKTDTYYVIWKSKNVQICKLLQRRCNPNASVMESHLFCTNSFKYK